MVMLKSHRSNMALKRLPMSWPDLLEHQILMSLNFCHVVIQILYFLHVSFVGHVKLRTLFK